MKLTVSQKSDLEFALKYYEWRTDVDTRLEYCATPTFNSVYESLLRG